MMSKHSVVILFAFLAAIAALQSTSHNVRIDVADIVDVVLQHEIFFSCQILSALAKY